MKKSILFSVLVVVIAVVAISCKKTPAEPDDQKSKEALITSVTTQGFTLTGTNITGVIAKEAPLNSVKLDFTISAKATAVPASGSTFDLTSTKTIVVTAEDGTTKTTYNVSASNATQ